MSVYWEKSKQRWRFDYQGKIAGRRIRARKLLPAGWTKAQAEKYAREEIQRLFDVGNQPELTIDACVLHYLQDKTHLKSHSKVIEHLDTIQSKYEGRLLSELTDVARDITDYGRERGWSAATIHQRLALLKAACRHAWKHHDACEADPTTKMLLPTVRNARQVYASRAQALAMARACDRRDSRALVLLAFYTGMRLGELQRCTVVGEVLSVPDTKNGEPRLIPIHPRVRVYTQHLPLSAPKITLQRSVQRARRACGLVDVRIHDLRHSAASEMVNAGVDLYTVGAVLGHKDARSTKRYAHLATQTLAVAVGKIGKSSPTKGKKIA